MKYLRFYYFAFIKNNNRFDSHIIALMIVELSFFFLIMFILLILDRFAFDQTRAMFAYRGTAILINLVFLYYLYSILVKNGKSDLIYEEFIDHPMNTRKNCILCYAIWGALVLLPLVTGTILHGSISLT